MSLVSVITAVHPASAAYLGETYASLAAQEMPPGWSWEWVVQEDGESGAVAALLPDDPRISPGDGRRGGPGVARTLSLGRASGELVKVLDADDALPPGALARDIAVMTAHPSVGWVTSRVLDLAEDGSVTGWDHADPPAGWVEPGEVLAYWRSHDQRLPVHPASLCIRRGLLLALGGWMALPASEDTGLLIAASVVSPGWFNASPGLLYRKWPGQATAQAAHVHPGERAARMRVIDTRAEALAGMGVLPSAANR